MSGIGNKSGSANSRRKRVIKVAPMTRAVRLALAASLAALALGASSAAFAAGCKAPSAMMTPCADTSPVLDLTVVHDAASPGGHGAFIMPLAISVSDPGDVVIDNADPISESSAKYGATAISGYSSGGNVEITNEVTGTLEATSILGDAIGIYGYSMTGDVWIDNSGDITATSYTGLADGIFASGANVNVGSSGALEVEGDTWAAGIEAQGSDSTTVTNDGTIYAASGAGTSYGIYATGDVVDVTNNGGINAQGYFATGIEAQGGSSVTITNEGDIVAGSITTYYDPYTSTTTVYGSSLATGINAASNDADGAISVTNNGSISAVGYVGGTGIAVTATGTGGSASVTNNGSIYASQYTKYGYEANGIVASADGDATIDNTSTGSITVVSAGSATGAAALSFAGNASVTNAGDISVENTAILYFGAYGIVSFGQNGTAYAGNSGNIDVISKYNGVGIDVSGLEGASADNSGDIAVDAWHAYGIRANSGAGDVSVDNSGSIYSTYSGGYFAGTAFGILATSTQGDVSVDNSGEIATTVYGQSVGIFGRSDFGSVDVSNSGTITAYSYNNYGVGIFARADYGTASVDNSGSISAESYYGDAFGVSARGAYVDVSNSGDISANGFSSATGIAASSYYGTTVTTTGGSIFAIAVDNAYGINGQSAFGDVTVDNASSIEAVSIAATAKGIQGYAFGNVHIDNSGDIYAGSLYGDAIGIYGYSIAGDVSIHNSGNLEVTSYYGLADGIFASGANVDVNNSGAVAVYGSTWAAGIEAQGADSTSVTNYGDISVTAPGFYQAYDPSDVLVAESVGSHAFGIYATAGEGGLEIVNHGNITVDGGYAAGIEAQSSGDITINNSGNIVAGSDLSQYYNEVTGYTYFYGATVATGINASSTGDGAAIDVINSGDIAVYGIYSASGIAATATGTGGTASITNSGEIYVSLFTGGAYGIVASGDGDAAVNNSLGGSITVTSGGSATGASALSFAGNASATNVGDISVTSTSMQGAAYGIVSFAQNGAAYVDNSGSVAAVAGYMAKAVDASGFTGVTVVNSGSLSADSFLYASYGVYAASGTGDVSVTNTATGSIEAYSYIGRGFGVLGIATQGDVMVDNAGSVEVYGFGQSVGLFGYASAGDVSTINSGSITAITGGSAAVGMFARADYGTASVDNSGDILASVEGVNDGYVGNAAYGIIARGAYAEVSNSGNIEVVGFYTGIGIAASSYYGSTVTTTGGSIYAYAIGEATGIVAQSQLGNVSVTNASDITAIGIVFGATGIQAKSGGETQVSNSGDIYATSVFDSATGIYAIGGMSSVDNSGSITAVVDGDIARVNGIINAATYLGDATTTNSGDVHVIAQGGTAPYGEFEAVAFGIYNLAVIYDSVVTNSGTVSAAAVAMDDLVDYYSYFSAKAIGVQAVNVAGYGASIIDNSGTIEAVSATSLGFSSAWGAVAQGRGLYGDVGISNEGNISAYSYTNLGTSYSIGAYTKAVGGDMAVINHGDIESVAVSQRSVLYSVLDASYAVGVKMISPAYYGAGSATLENYGNIHATAYSVGGITGATGVKAYGAHTSITNHAGATISATGEVGLFGGGHATGIEAGGLYGIDIVNDGDIEVHGIAHGLAEGPVTYYAGAGAVGIYARANYQGDVNVTNNGDINAIATTTDGITFFNAGAGATGIHVYAKYDATVVNAGDINAIATSDLGITTAYGVMAKGRSSASVINEADATIHAQAYVHSLATDMYGGRAIVFGTHTFGSDYATTTNAGHIVATATVIDDGVANEGTSLASAWGASIGAYSTSVTGTIVNNGDIQALARANFGFATSYGTFINTQRMADTTNTGLIRSSAWADNGDAFAVGSYANALHGIYYVPTDPYGYPDYGNVTFTPDDGHAILTNTGDITVLASASGGIAKSYGAVVRGAFGSIITNSGHIIAEAAADDAQATGALAVSFYGASSIENSGLIQARADGDLASATGVGALGLGDDGVYVGNTGNIIAAAYGDDATATAIRMESGSTNTLVNSGIISALGDGERIAISSEGDAMADLWNEGLINGAIQTGDLDDRFENASGGVWNVNNQSTDFGDGNDVIINDAGGLIAMTNGAIHMGSGPSNSFLNLGVIKVSGNNNLIDMGAGNTGAFTNVNLINFLDGAADDKLAVTGIMGGTGALGLDVNLLTLSSDQLSVNGNMAANAVQHVDILFNGMPLTAHTSIAFANVTGNSIAGNFVAGQILSYNYPRNFLDLRYGVTSSINAANTAPDVFSVNLDVAGLLDSGAIAADVASGAGAMLNAQIGTLRQRLGVNPYGDAGKVMSAFVRFTSSEGDVDVAHEASNFGQGGNFAYSMNVWSREVGVNANLFDTFHAGVTVGTADGNQRLTGTGIGQNRMDGTTWGAYATWYGEQGYYVDLSGRWMAVDVTSTSAAGSLQSRAHTAATNLEMGYPWTTGSGFVITPQFQYTWTKVNGIKTIFGDRANVVGQGGDSSRGRLGVEFSKTFDNADGLKITPYGSLNVIREFDGRMDYSVSNTFFGNTSTEGTSGMVDVGVGFQKGGWGITAAANWTDGGVLKSVVGGQLQVRLAW